MGGLMQKYSTLIDANPSTVMTQPHPKSLHNI